MSFAQEFSHTHRVLLICFDFFCLSAASSNFLSVIVIFYRKLDQMKNRFFQYKIYLCYCMTPVTNKTNKCNYKNSTYLHFNFIIKFLYNQDQILRSLIRQEIERERHAEGSEADGQPSGNPAVARVRRGYRLDSVCWD